MIRVQKRQRNQKGAVVCMAVHSSLLKIALAREGVMIEIWEYKKSDSPDNTPQRFALIQRSATVPFVTPCGLFWEDLSNTTGEYKEVLVMATLSGQFVIYSADQLHIRLISESNKKGFFAVSMKAIFLDHTMLDGLAGFTPLYAAALENGFLEIYSGAPRFEVLAIGSRHTMASMALSVCFDLKGKSIFLGDDRGHVQRFDTESLLIGKMRGQNVQKLTSSVMPSHIYYLQMDATSPPYMAVSLCSVFTQSALAVGTNTGDIFFICLVTNVVRTRLQASKYPIRCLSCISDNCILSGGSDRILIVIFYYQKNWTIRNCSMSQCFDEPNSVCCIEAVDASANEPLFAIVNRKGALLCRKSVPSIQTSTNPVRFQENIEVVVNCPPFEFWNNRCCVIAVNGMYLHFKVTRMAEVCVSRIFPNDVHIDPFVYISSNEKTNELSISVSKNSRYLVLWNTKYLRILLMDWIHESPVFRPYSSQYTSKHVFHCIQDITFGYRFPDECQLFVVSNNDLFTMSMESVAVEWRLSICHSTQKLTSQQEILAILCTSGEYLIWDESMQKVLMATAKYALLPKSMVMSYVSPPSCPFKTTDIAFLHNDPWVDFLKRPRAFILVNNVGEFKIVSIEQHSMGIVLYASKDYCRGVYPLPAQQFRVAIAPVKNPSGSILEDTNIFIFSASYVALFELTKIYEGGIRTSLRKEFSDICLNAFMKDGISDNRLAFCPIRDVSMILPLFPQDELPSFFFLRE